MTVRDANCLGNNIWRSSTEEFSKLLAFEFQGTPSVEFLFLNVANSA